MIIELYDGRPDSTDGRLPKEIRTYDFLDSLGIEYKRTDHEPANNMEACSRNRKKFTTVLMIIDSTVCRHLLIIAAIVIRVCAKAERKAQEVADVVSRIETVKPTVYREIDGLEFETVPAYNTLKPFHPKSAEWVGYVIRIDGKRIYIAGDTDAIKEAKAVKCDIAFVPIGGTYTMDAKKAAELVNTIHPYIAVPVHYGSIVGKSSGGEVFAESVKSPVKVVIKIQF